MVVAVAEVTLDKLLLQVSQELGDFHQLAIIGLQCKGEYRAR